MFIECLVDKIFCDKICNYCDIMKNLSESNKKKNMNKYINFEIIVLFWLIYKCEIFVIEYFI